MSDALDALDAIIPAKPQPFCTGCKKRPDELAEYVEAAAEEEISPDDYVRQEEGTYNPRNGHFLCTICYCAAGSPTAPGRGWKAP